MPLKDIGSHAYHYAAAVNTLSLTPLNDRALVVTRIFVEEVSADDIWRVKTQGYEAGAFDIQTDGNQQPLAAPQTVFPSNNNIFNVYELITGEVLTYPVPLGQTLTIASDGGATADVFIEYVEVAPQELSPGMMNHPKGNRIVCPLVGYIAAALTAAGEAKFDTQVGPTWVPNIFVDGDLPTNWSIKIIAMFLAGGSVNTFSGAADHVSTTQYLAVTKNGQLMYTRDASGGIPLVGETAAAGSGNTVVDTDLTPYPAFQEVDMFNFEKLDEPLVLGGGDSYKFRLDVTGSFTGSPSYEMVRQMFLCDIRSPG
jgi:hypothetical protein